VNENTAPSPTDLSFRAVAQVWSTVLERRSLAEDMPFDAAGGDSLQLLKVIFLLEEVCGVRLPMDRCRMDMRPSDFASLLDDARGPVPVPRAVAETVFFFPGKGGDSPLLAQFRAACAPEIAFVTIDLPDWPEVVEAGLDLEAVALSGAERVTDLSPSGPLFLAGASMGGSMAFAVARSLVRNGRDVRFVGVLDTDVTLPTDHDRIAVHPLRRLYWSMTALANAMRQGRFWEPLASLTVQELNRPGRARLLRHAQWLRHARLPGGFVYYLNRYMREVLHGCMHRAWRAEVTAQAAADIPAVLFRTEQGRPEASHDEAMGWRALCPGIQIVQVSGNHDTMWRPPHLTTLRARFVEEVLKAMTSVG